MKIEANKPMKISTLRRDIFNVVDHIIETGQSVELEREGHKLKIILDEKKDKFLNLVERKNVILCSDDELMASPAEWSGEQLI